MVSSISGSSQISQLLSRGASSNASRIAALEKQISTKEAEAKENQDALKAATIAAELASLRAELAKLKAAATKNDASESESAGTAVRQTELANDRATTKSGRRI